MDTETRYANIKQELLAIVFGCEKFHTYLYGRSFVVESDHKPLEMICLKNLISAPVRLQRMLLRLQQYNMVIMYQPGKEMLLADALSHLPSRANNTEIKLDLWVDTISFVTFSSSQLTKTTTETQKDPILSTVHWLTLNGWPQSMKTQYQEWHAIIGIFRDELLIKGDLLIKGERIIIPTSCRDSILADLHRSHEGANRSLSLAKTCMYTGQEWKLTWWITSDGVWPCIDNVKMPVETLHPHEVPAGPWIKIGMDFLQDDSGQKFLIIADYFSKFLLIFPVTSTHHQKTLRYLRDLFLTKGVPAVVMTDNGPPFNGEESQMLHERIWLQAPDVLTTLPSIEWIHQGHGQESQSHIQKDGWIPKYSSESPTTVMQHTWSWKTYHHQQKFYTVGPHKELAYPDVTDPLTSQESTDDY